MYGRNIFTLQAAVGINLVLNPEGLESLDMFKVTG
jgi:hypothetical protein